MDRSVAIADLQRVATQLGVRSLSRSRYDAVGEISSATIEAAFGSWNEAIVAAGLQPLPQGGQPRDGSPVLASPSDDDLLDDLVRLASELGRRPSGNQISAKGYFSREAYQRRWGSIEKAYAAAIARSAPSTP